MLWEATTRRVVKLLRLLQMLIKEMEHLMSNGMIGANFMMKTAFNHTMFFFHGAVYAAP